MRLASGGVAVLAAAAILSLLAFPLPILLFVEWPLALVGFAMLAFHPRTRIAAALAAPYLVVLVVAGVTGMGITLRGGIGVDRPSSASNAIGSMILVLAMPASLAFFAAVAARGLPRMAGAVSVASVLVAPPLFVAGAPDGALFALLAFGAPAGYLAFGALAAAAWNARGTPWALGAP